MRSELAAKGIGSASSAAVTSVASAIPTTTCPAFHTPVTKTSTHTSIRSSVSSREPAASSVAAAAGCTTAYHSRGYDIASHDYDRHSVPHVTASWSSSVASAIDDTNRYGTDRMTSSYQLPSSLSLSSSVPVSTADPRPLHTISTVDKTYYGDTTGSVRSTYSSYGSYHSGGHATRSSRKDDYDKQQASKMHHSSDTAYVHSAVSRTGVYDTHHRYH